MNYSVPKIERERAVLVALVLPGTPSWLVDDHLDELESLADTAGADVVDRATQRRMKPDPATLIGTGKISDIKKICAEHQAKLIIFDDDLSPAQVRNLEKRFSGKVLDRSGLILDIFATRARTREARVQVELAQLEYYYPRLTRQWSHLRGSQGGIGFRGPGETQLEVDRRAVQKRITRFKRELGKIAKQRETRRSGRKDTPTVALVGYTNVGKSTLLNSLTGTKDAFVENRLFATLDPKVRRIESAPGHPVLVIDTVGFIRKLPHHLVASFRSTLEEAKDADLILHVADLSHPLVEEQMKQTHVVLKDLGLSDTPQILVFNKIDALKEHSILLRMQEKYPEAVAISARKGLRTWELVERIDQYLYAGKKRVRTRIASDRMDLLEQLPDTITILSREWSEGSILVHLSGPPHVVDSLLQNPAIQSVETAK